MDGVEETNGDPNKRQSYFLIQELQKLKTSLNSHQASRVVINNRQSKLLGKSQIDAVIEQPKDESFYMLTLKNWLYDFHRSYLVQMQDKDFTEI